MPGPGTFSPKVEISAGSTFYAGYKSSPSNSFYHHDRRTVDIPKNSESLPGPGTYKMPSDFGYIKLVKRKGNSQKRIEKPILAASGHQMMARPGGVEQAPASNL